MFDLFPVYGIALRRKESMGFKLFVTPRSWPGGVRGAIESAAPVGAERVKHRARSCLKSAKNKAQEPRTFRQACPRQTAFSIQKPPFFRSNFRTIFEPPFSAPWAPKVGPKILQRRFCSVFGPPFGTHFRINIDLKMQPKTEPKMELKSYRFWDPLSPET